MRAHACVLNWTMQCWRNGRLTFVSVWYQLNFYKQRQSVTWKYNTSHVGSLLIRQSSNPIFFSKNVCGFYSSMPIECLLESRTWDRQSVSWKKKTDPIGWAKSGPSCVQCTSSDPGLYPFFLKGSRPLSCCLPIASMDHIKLITFSPLIRATAAMRGTPRCSVDRPRAERTKLQRHVRPPFVWQHRVSSGILPGDGTAAVGSTCAYTSNQKKAPSQWPSRCSGDRMVVWPQSFTWWTDWSIRQKAPAVSQFQAIIVPQKKSKR